MDLVFYYQNKTHSSFSFPCTSTAVFCYIYWVCILVQITGKTNCQLIVFIHTKRCGETTPWPPCASALLGCISAAVTWHAGCIGNMRVSLVKCRSCRTGCSCTAETGICTVPGGAVRNTWGTAPEGGENTWWSICIFSRVILMWQPITGLCVSPVSWPCAWDTCMAEVPWEKALSTASPPSRDGVEAYITVWGLGYIMWPATDVGTDEVTMVAGRLTVAGGRAGEGGREGGGGMDGWKKHMSCRGQEVCMFVGQQVALLAHLQIQLVPYAVAQKHNSFETRAIWTGGKTKWHNVKRLGMQFIKLLNGTSPRKHTNSPPGGWNLNNETGQQVLTYQ